MFPMSAFKFDGDDSGATSHLSNISSFHFDVSQIVPDTEVRPAVCSSYLKSNKINIKKSLQILDESAGVPSRSTQTVGSKISSEKNISVLDDLSLNSSELATTNVTLLLTENSSLASGSVLFPQFLNAFHCHQSEGQAFRLMQEYVNLCYSHWKDLHRVLKRSASMSQSYRSAVPIMQNIHCETSTWRLVHSLYKDRLMSADEVVDDTMGSLFSEHEVAVALLERNAGLRQIQLVIDWLETESRDLMEDYFTHVAIFNNRSVAWENTLHALKQRRAGVSVHSSKLVSELDPDAPLRQNGALTELDREDEVNLFKYIFACLRAGQLNQAQAVCRKSGSHWRAAMLEGWKLHHDPNHSLSGAGEKKPIVGNPNRTLWKLCCWNMSCDPKVLQEERLIFASLCSNLQVLLPHLNSWQDQLWAHCRALVDISVQRELDLKISYTRPQVSLPVLYWQQETDLQGVFAHIQASTNKNVQKESQDKFRVIQRLLIMGDLECLVEELHDWTRDSTDLHLLRFSVHLILSLSSLGLISRNELFIAIIESFVGALIESPHADLSPQYITTLPEQQQIEWGAQFIRQKNNRNIPASLQLLRDAHLNVLQICKLLVEKVRQVQVTPNAEASEEWLTPKISAEDQDQIDALSWLLQTPDQHAEALFQANAMMRVFLACGKTQVAQKVFNKLPADSVEVVYKEWERISGCGQLDAHLDNIVREYLCHKAYLDANESFSDWFKHYHHSRPEAPQPLEDSNNFMEKVAFEHQMKSYQQDLDRWQRSLDLQTTNTKEKIYNVLLFVDGGWLIDQRLDIESEEYRRQQMQQLRHLLIPRLLLLLHTVLHSTEQYREALQLADVIASEKHNLYSVFSKDELCKLLSKLKESSIALLDRNLDSFGYDLK